MAVLTRPRRAERAATRGSPRPAALVFLSEARLEGRQALAVYPIVLFYFVVGWMVLISKSILD